MKIANHETSNGAGAKQREAAELLDVRMLLDRYPLGSRVLLGSEEVLAGSSLIYPPPCPQAALSPARVVARHVLKGSREVVGANLGGLPFLVPTQYISEGPTPHITASPDFYAPWFVKVHAAQPVEIVSQRKMFTGSRVSLDVETERGGVRCWVGAAAVLARLQDGDAVAADWVLPSAAPEPLTPVSLPVPSEAYLRLNRQLVGNGSLPQQVTQGRLAKKRRREVEAGAQCLVKASHALRLIHKAGEGTYGEVHRGESVHTGTVLAIKRLRDERDKEREVSRQRGLHTTTLRELSTLASLADESPHIVKLCQTHIGVNRHIYAAFEWVENDLSGVLSAAATGGGIDRRVLRNVARQVLKGLAYIHSLRLVHRDLKPSNILLSSLGVVKLCDFGFINEVNLASKTPTVCTPSYRPPEVLFQTTKHLCGLDMWGFGCVLWRMLAPSSLFKAAADPEALRHLISILGCPVPQGHPAVCWPDLFRSPGTYPAFPKTPLKQVTFENRRFPLVVRQNLRDDQDLSADLLARLLYWDPEARITAQEALQHPYFGEGRVVPDHQVVVPSKSSKPGIKLVDGCILELQDHHVFLQRHPESKFEKKI